MPLRPNTFLDLVFMANAQPTGGTEIHSFEEHGRLAVGVSGTYRSDPTFAEHGTFEATFLSGVHYEAQRNGTYPVEDATGTATFRSGLHYFTLIDYGDLTDTGGLSSASFSSGTHAFVLVIDGSNAPLDSGAASASFDAGTHEFILNDYGSLTETGTLAAGFNAGTYLHVAPGDGKNGGYVVRFNAENGDTVLTVEYADNALTSGHVFDYLLGVYTLGNIVGTVVSVDPPFYGDASDNRYQILTEPPVIPPPQPPFPGTGSLNYDIESTANGTGAVAAVSFFNGTYFLFGTQIEPSYEQGPMFATFHAGTHQFFTVVDTVMDNGTAFVSFQEGTHFNIIVDGGTGLSDNGSATASFQTGRMTVGVPTFDASVTVITADTGTLTTDMGYVAFDQTPQTMDLDIYRMDQSG